MGLMTILIFLVLLLCADPMQAKKLYVIHTRNTLTQQGAHAHNHETLASVLGSTEAARDSMVYSYKNGLRGFAAYLTDTQANHLRKKDGVLSVLPNKVHRLHTTHSWDFLQGGSAQQWEGNDYADTQNVIIGMLDGGIWPESKSFDDTGMDPIPKRWKGVCTPGQAFSTKNCNRKIIGARFYTKGIQAEGIEGNFTLSARDDDGHGSHTASTAAGRVVQGVSFPGGIAQGTARGGAPLARLAIYKICWDGQCADADILAALDDAIGDGVDIISMSLGPDPPQLDFFSDSISIGTFHAMRHGILVSCSAGNSGFPGTVSNSSPWLLTVGASSIDRDLQSNVMLGNKLLVEGRAVNPEKIQSKLVLASTVAKPGVQGANASFCFNNTLDPTKAKGNIIVCLQPNALDSRLAKSFVVKQSGGAGMILIDETLKEVAAVFYGSATLVGAEQGSIITSYINKTSYPVATVFPTKTIIGSSPAPRMAVFTSRGPNNVAPDIIKPDIAAPGVSILAAWSPVAVHGAGGRIVDYNIISGTSMACPHITGIAANLKARFPTWTAAALKSAIMTTASTLDNTGAPINNQFFNTVAGPFDYGAGHVKPDLTFNPGFVYDTSFDDYVGFLCSIGSEMRLRTNLTLDGTHCPRSPVAPYNMNYPSIAVARLTGEVLVYRTVTNYGSLSSMYQAKISAPPGVLVTVTPPTLRFEKLGEKKTFAVKFTVKSSSNGNFVFGSLTWSDGKHVVSSPIAVNAMDT